MRANRILGWTAGLTLLVAIATAAVVRAQTPGGAWANGRAFGFRHFVALNHIGRQLNLTAQQQQQIKDLVKSRKDDIKSVIDQGFAARKALREAIAAGNNDAISAAVTRMSAVELKGAQLRAQLRAKIFSDVLQPDQRSKAGELLAQSEQRADRRRQRIERFLDTF